MRNKNVFNNIQYTILCSLFIAHCSLFSTPSTQIWISSTDFQKFGTYHLGIDNFIRVHNVLNSNGEMTRGAAMCDMGITAGIFPWKNLQGELGIDYISMGDAVYDKHPLYFNFKIGTPENIFFKGAPAIAFGAYNFGTKSNLTNYNVGYGIIAKTFKAIGRLSAGYYIGNSKVLTDEKGNISNSGLLASWDRQMNEISDKLWFGIDYQGGKNYLSSLNFGVSWAFSSNVSLLAGYCVYNNSRVLYNSKDMNANSFTTQLDINF
jgi:hypothetical protein